jgi:hypothetical protein
VPPGAGPPDAAPRVRSIDERSARAIAMTLAVVVAIEPLMVIILLALLGVPWYLIVLIALAMVVLPALTLAVIVRVAWAPLARRYPARPDLAGAVRGRYESFRLGRFTRIGHGMHITVDEEHLHLDPIALLRWVGARRISLPWARMTDVRPAPGRLGAPADGMIAVTIDGRRIAGPAWCMTLASAAEV